MPRLSHRPHVCRILGSFPGVLLLLSTTLGADAFALGLDEYYAKALDQSEVLQSAKLDVSISASERQRIESTVKPRVTFEADGSYHFNKPDRTDWRENKSAGIRTEFRQPLYDGGVSAAATKAGDAAIEGSKWDFKTDEQNLYLQVASLFYDLLSQNKDLINLEESIKLYRRRSVDLSKREKIGRSREAEVFSARTQLELANSEIAATRIAIGADEEQLAWLSGLTPPLKLDDPLRISDLQPRTIPVVKAVIPSVQAASYRIEAAQAQIDLVRAGRNPKLDFIAAHGWSYLDPSEQGAHDLSLGLGLSWTLYDAGEINAEVNTASLQKNKAEIAKRLADREGDLNLRIAKRKLEESLVQIKTYQTALDVVEKTLKAQQSEFDSGLITNLELLTTLDQRLAIRRNLDQTIYRAKLVYVQSKVYAGQAGGGG